MKTKKSNLTSLISSFAIAANIVFASWILYNGMHEGFEGTLVEKISYLSLTVLLIVNALLLWAYHRKA